MPRNPPPPNKISASDLTKYRRIKQRGDTDGDSFFKKVRNKRFMQRMNEILNREKINELKNALNAMDKL